MLTFFDPFDHFVFFRTIWNHPGLLGTTRDQLGLFGPIKDQ